MSAPNFSKIRQSLDANPDLFEELALNVFQYQAVNNFVYREFLEHLGCNVQKVRRIADIPFLPIRFFKTHEVLSKFSSKEVQTVFTSSGTTGIQTSKHYVADKSIYVESALNGFSRVYGDPKNWIFLALLPSYLEREGSSLIDMMEMLMNTSQHPLNGFYLNQYNALENALIQAKSTPRKVMLVGVSFALLDAAECGMDASGCVVMETGGMKGRRKEMIRSELHELLSAGLNVPEIHSEYGMTELLSQAYSTGKGIFETPPWLQFFARDTQDPYTFVSSGKTGGLNLIDLANVHSCAFIETQDLARQTANGQWEILGRFDHSDVRGCNLMVR